MRREEPCKAFAQRARAVAVNDADTLAVCQSGLVEKFVDAIGGFFEGGTDYVDFIGGAGVAGSRVHRDVLPLRRWRGGFCIGWRAFNACDLIYRDLHA